MKESCLRLSRHVYLRNHMIVFIQLQMVMFLDLTLTLKKIGFILDSICDKCTLLDCGGSLYAEDNVMVLN